MKKQKHLIQIHNLLKGRISIAASANFDVPKNEFVNKRHKNSYQIFSYLTKRIV